MKLLSYKNYKMNIRIITVLLAGLATACVLPAKKDKAAMPVKIAPATPSGFEPIALIELFTSQGCSSCPPADRLLARTIAASAGKKIFALSYHVDYWNRLGWTDPFSNAAFSQRQTDYVSVMHLNGAYTPQMVVNGTTEFVGSEEGSLKKALSKALSQNARVSFSTLKTEIISGSPIKIEYKLEGDYAGKEISFALVSLEEMTSVKRGENGGSTLKNENVVRQLITQKAAAAGTAAFALSPVPVADNLAVVAFVQEKGTGAILGAAMENIL
jgi:hypothetical protein